MKLSVVLGVVKTQNIGATTLNCASVLRCRLKCVWTLRSHVMRPPTKVMLGMIHDLMNQHVLTSTSCIPEPPIWLYVQSMSLTAPQRASTASQVMADITSVLPAELLTNISPNVLKKRVFLDPAQAPSHRKKKRVQFVDTAANTVQLTNIISPISHITIPEFNLCQAKSMCQYLKGKYGACTTSISKDCVGYLETPCQMYKHNFYLRAQDRASNLPQSTTVYSVSDIMQHEPDNVLLIEDQLKLAHKAALAVLQYNDTPWLAERWRLDGMSYFGSPHSFDETALETLHLSSQISRPNQPSINTATMRGVQSTETTVSDEIKYGINNTPLFFLGVALLEIAHWKPLEKKMLPRDQQDQVYTARRLADGRIPLGLDYQKIVQKCLRCDFGFGNKLSSKSLQTAVYNDVVCELEGLIEGLSV
jgi:hypothetical protein